MNVTHLEAFLKAAAEKDLDAMLTHMTEDVIFRTPLAVEPLRGKAAIRPMVQALLAAVDKFEFVEMMKGPGHISLFFKVTIGSVQLDGMDYWLVDDEGLIREMTVFWRPLPAMLEVQRKLAH